MTFWKKKGSTEVTSSQGLAASPSMAGPSFMGPSAVSSSAPSAVSSSAPSAVGHSNPGKAYTEQTISAQGDYLITKYGKVRSALSVGTVIQGKLNFDTPVSIDGKLSGEIFSSETLIVGKSGRVDAQLEVASLVVMGTVTGTIVAKQRIEVASGGRLEGSITAPLLKIEDGAIFNGKCSMGAQHLSQKTKIIVPEPVCVAATQSALEEVAKDVTSPSMNDSLADSLSDSLGDSLSGGSSSNGSSPSEKRSDLTEEAPVN